MNLLKKIGIKYPIFLSPMAGVSTPLLAAKISNSGGLGSLGLGSSSIDQVRKQIWETQKLTKKPFQVNFFCHQDFGLDIDLEKKWIIFFEKEFLNLNAKVPKTLNKLYESFSSNDDYLNVLLELKPKIVSFHFGLPTKKQIQALKNVGIITFASVTQLNEAKIAQGIGIDVLVAQGVEAGGHRGVFNPNVEPAILTKDLVQLLHNSAEINLPIVAAGGIMSGTDILDVLDLGASAAQLGTAFIQCSESAASLNYKKALFDQPVTQLSNNISGRSARGIISGWHENVIQEIANHNPGYPYCYALAKELSKAEEDSRTERPRFPIYWAGANVAKIRHLNATDLMNTLIKEMNL